MLIAKNPRSFLERWPVDNPVEKPLFSVDNPVGYLWKICGRKVEEKLSTKKLTGNSQGYPQSYPQEKSSVPLEPQQKSFLVGKKKGLTTTYCLYI